jgi:hypothetical protein
MGSMKIHYNVACLRQIRSSDRAGPAPQIYSRRNAGAGQGSVACHAAAPHQNHDDAVFLRTWRQYVSDELRSRDGILATRYG